MTRIRDARVSVQRKALVRPRLRQLELELERMNLNLNRNRNNPSPSKSRRRYEHPGLYRSNNWVPRMAMELHGMEPALRSVEVIQ